MRSRRAVQLYMHMRRVYTRIRTHIGNVQSNVARMARRWSRQLGGVFDARRTWGAAHGPHVR